MPTKWSENAGPCLVRQRSGFTSPVSVRPHSFPYPPPACGFRLRKGNALPPSASSHGSRIVTSFGLQS